MRRALTSALHPQTRPEARTDGRAGTQGLGGPDRVQYAWRNRDGARVCSLDDSLISTKWFSLIKTRGRGTAGSSVAGCVKRKTEQKSDTEAHRSAARVQEQANLRRWGQSLWGVGATTGSRPAMVSDVLVAFRAGTGNPENSVNLLRIHLCIFIRICYASIKMSMTKSPRDRGRDWNFLTLKKGSAGNMTACTTPCYVTCELA